MSGSFIIVAVNALLLKRMRLEAKPPHILTRSTHRAFLMMVEQEPPP